MKIEDVLVPVDFSPNSVRAIDFAASLLDGDGELCLLHVIDSGFVERLASEGFSEPAQAIEKLRNRAQERLEETIAAFQGPKPHFESMIVVGRPFSEILRVATDLDFQLIVMGTHSVSGEDIEELLFGSTAEKVLRGTRIPVMFVPDGVETSREEESGD
ncbi:MAG TPA: universal stress protein [Blastocatellia bacterium]